MEEQLQKSIEEIRNNSKCKKILVMSSNKYVLKKIENMNLEDVRIFPISLLGNHREMFEGDKIYILPDFKEEQTYLDWNE